MLILSIPANKLVSVGRKWRIPKFPQISEFTKFLNSNSTGQKCNSICSWSLQISTMKHAIVWSQHVRIHVPSRIFFWIKIREMECCFHPLMKFLYLATARKMGRKKKHCYFMPAFMIPVIFFLPRWKTASDAQPNIDGIHWAQWKLPNVKFLFAGLLGSSCCWRFTTEYEWLPPNIMMPYSDCLQEFFNSQGLS